MKIGVAYLEVWRCVKLSTYIYSYNNSKKLLVETSGLESYYYSNSSLSLLSYTVEVRSTGPESNAKQFHSP